MYLQMTYPRMTRHCLPEGSNDTTIPSADVLDDGDSYQIILEMPGVTQEGLSIELEAKALVIRGERKAYDENAKLLHAGRMNGTKLERRFSLGDDVDRAAVTAHLENGLLSVKLPRKAEVKSRKIKVEVK